MASRAQDDAGGDGGGVGWIGGLVYGVVVGWMGHVGVVRDGAEWGSLRFGELLQTSTDNWCSRAVLHHL